MTTAFITPQSILLKSYWSRSSQYLLYCFPALFSLVRVVGDYITYVIFSRTTLVRDYITYVIFSRTTLTNEMLQKHTVRTPI